MRYTAAIVLVLGACCAGCAFRAGAASGPRTVTVAQSGSADVIGADSAALQKAARMLRPGDTLSIGPGTWAMDNSLFVPSSVTVRGVAGQTILRKSRGVESALVEDADYGDTFLRVADPSQFRPGMGVSVSDDKLNSGWDISISSVAAVKLPYVILDPMTLRDYNAEQAHARLRNTFPILVAEDAANVTFEGLTVDGNRAENAYIDGCRGGAIYMYRVRNVTVRNCVARNYNGDGISFQISDGVRVENCESYGHAGYGVHPGTGSANAVVQACRLHDNGDIGLFLCWRVRHSRFAGNVIESNGHYGISIGHKDTDNEFVDNTIARNGVTGVYFREETQANSGHRNVFRGNKVLDNGNARQGYGFYVEPHAGDLLIEGNQIGDTRSNGATQKTGIYAASGAGSIEARNNTTVGQDREVAVIKASAGR
ncbi:MAG TPA: right-handed parallel beta-helix repeat-containing protein [Bryobacteraceae bacterium]|nr:right-handed parallel beta-helix repeat-containing protein [Bryobacteraceae bacterium]